jgi:hypothetical protein
MEEVDTKLLTMVKYAYSFYRFRSFIPRRIRTFPYKFNSSNIEADNETAPDRAILLGLNDIFLVPEHRNYHWN